MQTTKFTQAALFALTVISSASAFAGDHSHKYGSDSHSYDRVVITRKSTVRSLPTGGSYRARKDYSKVHPRSYSNVPYSLQLACIRCAEGDKGAAAKYIEQGIAALSKQSRTLAAHNRDRFNQTLRELKHQSSQLRAGGSVSLANLKSAIAGANKAVAGKAQHAAYRVGARSDKVAHATAEFGRDITKDTGHDVRYTGHRVKLLGGRIAKLVTKSASPVKH